MRPSQKQRQWKSAAKSRSIVAAATLYVGYQQWHLDTADTATLAPPPDQSTSNPDKTTQWEEPGQRGDYWGGHVGGFGALAGTFLFFEALLLQSHELSLQRKESAESRRVAKQQSLALEKQT